MEKEKLDIQVLLEIALNQRITGEIESSLPQILNLYLRKLNCFAVAIFKKNKWAYLLPNALKNNDLWMKKLDFVASELQNQTTEQCALSIEDAHFYGYPLHDYGWLILIRKNELSKEMYYELSKVVLQLGRDLCQAKEEQRLKLLQQLFDKASDGIQIVEDTGQLYYINQVASKRLGISQAEVGHFHVWDFEKLFFQNENAWHQHVEMLKKTGQIIVEGEHIHQETNQAFPVEVTVNLIAVKDKTFVIASARDISERKKNEQKLKETTQKIESIFNEMTDVVWSLKMPELQMLFVSPSVEKMYELKQESFVENIDKWSQIIHYEDFGIIKEIRNQLKNNGEFNVKYRIITPSGKKKWIRNKGKYVYDDDHKVVRLDGVMVDRTQQFIAQETLEQEVKLQEALIDIASTYINLDPKEVENTINQSLEKMGLFVAADRAYIFDYDFVKATTSNTYEWCNAGIEPELEHLQQVPIEFFPQWIEKHQKGEAFYVPDVQSLDDEKEGGLKAILTPQGIKSLIAIPMLDGKELIGFVGFDSVKKHHQYSDKEKRLLFLFGQMLINIRNRQKWDNQLRLQEEKYRNIIANMNLGLIEVNLIGDIIFANHSFCEMSGYSLAELKGQNVKSFFTSEKHKQLVTNIFDKSINNSSESFEIEVFVKNKKPRWWFISSAPQYNDKGQLMGSIGIHLDITEQKRLEQELAKAKTFAESAAKAKELFLANMSHEIRTPLNVIIGMIRQLTKENLSQDQHFYVKQSESSAKHLLTILNNVLDIAKIESGDMEIVSTSFSPSALAYNVHSIMFSQAIDKNLTFILNVDPEIKPVLLGDETRLRQVLINLVGNAIKFTENGTIQLSVTLISEIDNKQTLKFEVADSGIGMSEAFISKLFDKFSQEQNTTNRKYEGTGLGMAISRDLIRLMNSELKVQSTKSKGSVFSFNLNLEIGKPENLILIGPQVKEGVFKGKQALLVEDNEMNRFIAIQSLSFLGFDVVEAENGLIAIEKMKVTHFDLILMDIQMPVMDGLEATTFIREKLKDNTPIIALTANAFKHDIELYLSKGMNDYITKPYDEEDFFRKIEYAMHLVKNTENQTLKLEENPLFSLQYLEGLSRGDRSLVIKMLTIFVSITSENITKMELCLSTNDVESMKMMAHKMKPSIDQLEINTLKEVIRWLEQFDVFQFSIDDWKKNVGLTMQSLKDVNNQIALYLKENT